MKFTDAPIVGVTGTYYPDIADPRFEISLETVEAWRDHNLPLVIIDHDPDKNDRAKKAYRQRGATVINATTAGIATQRQQGAEFALSAGAEKLLTHEPEKPSVPVIAQDVAVELDTHSVVVIGRSDSSLETVPPFQLRTEKLAGYVLERTLRMPFDTLAGPRGYSRQGAQHLIDYPSHKPGMNNWIYLYDTILAARSNGEAVGGIAVDLMYPEKLVAQETNNPIFDRKRLDQFWLQLRYMMDRPEVLPEARGLARMVKHELDSVPANAGQKDLESTFARIEALASSEYGYQAP